MKKLYFYLLFLLPNFLFAQFGHLQNNEESDDTVIITMNDNSVKIGVIKNDKMSSGFLRAISLVTTDLNAFKHTNVVAEEVWFKEDNNTSFKKIDAKDIKQIQFKGKNELVYDRISVYKFKRSNFELKNSKIEYMFAIPQVDDVFKVYNKLFLSKNARSVENEQYLYFAKLRDSEITYLFKISPLVNSAYVFEYFKVFAPTNKKYTDYIDQLKKKDSSERKEYMDADKRNLEEFKLYMNGINSTKEDQRFFFVSRYYNFMFYFIGKKLEEFSS